MEEEGMKTLYLKGRMAALPLLLGITGAAFAHTQVGTLGAGAAATDYYQVTCSNDGSGAPASLAAQVQDDAPVAAPTVSVLVQKGVVATNSSDATDGDAVASPLVWVNGAAGVYNVFVSKTAAGADNYTLTYHCMTGANGGGIHTGTALSTKQNQ
jgi:hypothetical protein